MFLGGPHLKPTKLLLYYMSLLLSYSMKIIINMKLIYVWETLRERLTQTENEKYFPFFKVSTSRNPRFPETASSYLYTAHSNSFWLESSAHWDVNK